MAAVRAMQQAGIEPGELKSVVAPELVERYRKARDLMRTRLAHQLKPDDCRERIVFHGTTIQKAKSIARVGFDLSLCKRMTYGKGAYVSDFPLSADNYSADSTILICRAILGRSFEVSKTPV